MALWFSAVFAVAIAIGYRIVKQLLFPPPSGPNPFDKDGRIPKKPLVEDHKARDSVIKQGYTKKTVPDNLDAIVIGSGMGGLTAAAALAKAGKKVLVLEQHDQAGGCCHTFFERGFEFDTGIHYIGEMRNNTAVRYLFEQLTNGQITWAPLEDEYDRVMFGDPRKGDERSYPIMSGREEFRNALKAKFPKDHAAIDRYLELLDEMRKEMRGFVGVKFMPKWMTTILNKTGLIHYYTQYFKLASRSLADVLEALTDNVELRGTLAYCFGDYGTLPKDTSFAMHATLVGHFLFGVAYPVGGSSEIAFHMIPVIESAGGKVLVRARVSEILTSDDGKTAVGVRIERDGSEIRAPLIISDAGIYNTYESLLPEPSTQLPDIKGTLDRVQHGVGCMSVYIGLKGSAKDIGIKATNIWAFPDGPQLDENCDKFMKQTVDEVLERDNIPLLFVSFPSAKDPTWDRRFPNKSTCEIITLANWEWFENWDGKAPNKRGNDYKQIKDDIGKMMWDYVLAVYPQLKDKVEYFEVGSPVTNAYYIGSPRGEIYGVDHNLARFSSPETVSALKPRTPVNGLMLTGQDVFSGGFVGAMFGGLLCASEVLGRNLYVDLMTAKAKYSKSTKKKQ